MSPRATRPTVLGSLFSVALGNYGAIALSFLLSAVLTRRLGAEHYGRLALVIMAVQVLAALVSNWTLSGLIRFGAREFARTSSVAQTFWARMAIVAPPLLAVSIGLAFGQQPAARYLDVPDWAVWLVFGYFASSSLLLTLGSVLQASAQMHRYALALFLDKAVATAAILLLPEPLGSDRIAVIGCYAASSTLVLCAAVAALGSWTLRPVRTSRTAIAELWRFSLPFLVSTWVGIVGGQAIMYAILKEVRPASELGLYSLATQIAAVLQQISVVSASVLLPRFSVMVADRRDVEIKSAVERMMPYGGLGFSLFLALCALGAQPGLRLVFGPQFPAAATPLSLLIVGAMLMMFSNTFAALLTAHGLTRILMRIGILSAVVNVIGGLLLVPAFGGTGAAFASIVTYAATAVPVAAVVERRLGIRIFQFWLLLVPVALAVLGTALVPGATGCVVGGSALTFSVAVLVRRLRLFQQEDRATLVELGMPSWLASGLFKLSSTIGWGRTSGPVSSGRDDTPACR